MSKKMTGQVTKESDECEHMSLRNSLGMLKVLNESDNKLRSTMNIKWKPCLCESFVHSIQSVIINS